MVPKEQDSINSILGVRIKPIVTSILWHCVVIYVIINI